METYGARPQIPPDCVEDQVKLICKPPPPEGFDALYPYGTIGVKWMTASGDWYGDVLYLPPLVYAEVIKQMRSV